MYGCGEVAVLAWRSFATSHPTRAYGLKVLKLGRGGMGM